MRVRCRAEGEGATCQAKARLDTPPETLRAAIEDISSYPLHFASIEAARVADDRLVHLAFDLPFLLGDWSCASRVTRGFGPGWSLRLDVVESHGRTPLFDQMAFSLTPSGAGTLLTIDWHHDLGWTQAVRDRITRTQGHNLVWGLALATGTRPVAPAEDSSPR